MASKRLAFKKRTYSESVVERGTGALLHDGWAVKESGSAMFGKTNWRRRWFRLAQRPGSVTLEYYRSKQDRLPAGCVTLNATYSTRQLESREKPQPNCFAVGPLVDDGATRTYYISCPSQLAMREWMTVIDAAIQGVPELALHRKRTITEAYAKKHRHKMLKESSSAGDLSEYIGDPESSIGRGPSVESMLDTAATDVMLSETLQREDLSDDEILDDMEEEDLTASMKQNGAARCGVSQRYPVDSGLSPDEKKALYNNSAWRMEQWQNLCTCLDAIVWTKVDTKDGVTVARSKFGHGSGGHAVIKVEGVLPAEPRKVYRFLMLSTREGGKLDHMFRNENIVKEITDEPKAKVIYNEFHPPLPRVSKRDIVAMKIWVPYGLSRDMKCGMAMFSVDHPDVQPLEKGCTRIGLNTSGFVLTPHPGPDKAVHTKMTILVQIAFQGAMHRMLKGAYNSGLLKLGFRTTFGHIEEQLLRFTQVTSI